MEQSQDQYKSELADTIGSSTNITSGISETHFLLIIVAVSIGFLCISLMMSIYMIRRRKKEILKQESDKNLIDKYQNFLSNMIILPDPDNSMKLSTNECYMTERLQLADISDNYRRQILMKEIYSFKRYLQGNQAAQLASYFFGMGLQEDVITMLNKNSWTEKLMALMYIQAFDIRECLPQVIELLNHKNKDLAFQSLLTRLSLENDFDSISECYSELNDWEKHKLHEMATNQGISIGDYLLKEDKLILKEIFTV